MKYNISCVWTDDLTFFVYGAHKSLRCQYAASIFSVIKYTVKDDGTGSTETLVHIYVTCCLNSRAEDVIHLEGGGSGRTARAYFQNSTSPPR